MKISGTSNGGIELSLDSTQLSAGRERKLRLAERNAYANHYNKKMARWPRHVWTSIFTYATVFVLFPLLCLLAYAWVRGWF